jgi:hypothetical protein
MNFSFEMLIPILHYSVHLGRSDYAPTNYLHIQGDQNVSVHLTITVQKKYKNSLNSFNHLP